jgi:UDPglucose--hexose-1-phosphate uridylyltransferase
MPELRKDPVTGRWVIISTERRKRPSAFRLEHVAPLTGIVCPFCEGNEEYTPREVLSYRRNGAAANGPGWDVRVVPNKFPALQVEGGLDRQGEGLFDKMNGIGAHEVIIETPDHLATFAGLGEERIADVLGSYRERILDLEKDPRIQYVMVFKNHGEAAGASLEHPHSQLIATPIVPIMVEEELEGAERHFRIKKRCIWCDIIRQERRGDGRIILEADGFVALAPFAPRFPFETWILPSAHRSGFEETELLELRPLGRLLGEILRRMGKVLGDPPYNYMLHSAPLRSAGLDHFHWHLEIIPKLTRVAGFEWGTGFFINPTPPEEAARYLRGEVPGASVS